MESKKEGERIAKRLARAGVCSRRDAEKLIAEGRVSVNGKLLDSPAFLVTSADRILVDRKPVKAIEETVLYLYHKPAGLVTTHKDEKNRMTVFDDLPEEMGRVISVGRLDLNTEGLLLLTNDGELSRWLEHPSTGWKRRYRVRAHYTGEPITQEKLNTLKKGCTIDGVKYGSIEATLDNVADRNLWMTMTLTEGKNREIRKVCEFMGLQVNRLIRLSYGSFQLGKMPVSAIEKVDEKVLKSQLGGFFKQKESDQKPS
jgi:23S rRNA pseudouridine2605 synthase